MDRIDLIFFKSFSFIIPTVEENNTDVDSENIE